MCLVIVCVEAGFSQIWSHIAVCPNWTKIWQSHHDPKWIKILKFNGVNQDQKVRFSISFAMHDNSNLPSLHLDSV